MSGVGIYSRELTRALAAEYPEVHWRWLYRPHRISRAYKEPALPNLSRGILLDNWPRSSSRLFHGLNQRLPTRPFQKQIATFHDLFVMTAEYSTPEFRARFEQQARHAAATADRIIAVSHFTARQVCNLLRIESARVTVIPHGIRPLPIYDLPRKKTVLHVGAIQKRKNLGRLIRAFETLPSDWELQFAGSSGYGADEVYSAIATSRAASRIKVSGYANSDALARMYAEATIFAFPSLDEGFGMPVLEAMAAGTPVLTSNTSALKEVAGSAAWFVQPTSEEEIAEGLRRLAADPQLRGELTARGREHVQNFSWIKTARQTFAVYEEVLSI